MEIFIWNKSFWKLYWSEIVNGRKTGPDNFPCFPTQWMCAMKLAAYVFKYERKRINMLQAMLICLIFEMFHSIVFVMFIIYWSIIAIFFSYYPLPYTNITVGNIIYDFNFLKPMLLTLKPQFQIYILPFIIILFIPNIVRSKAMVLLSLIRCWLFLCLVIVVLLFLMLP